MKNQPDGIDLSCISPLELKTKGHMTSIYLDYKDENSGEYECVDPETSSSQKIYVKFHSESRATDFLFFFVSFDHRKLVLTLSVCSLWQLRGAGANFSDWARHGKPGGHHFDRRGGLSDRLSQPVGCDQLYQEKWDSTASIYAFKLTHSPFWCWNSEVVYQNPVKKGQMSPSKGVSCLPVGSDRQHLVPYEPRNRPPNDHYQVGSNLSPPPQAVKSNLNWLFFSFLSLLSFHDGSASEPQRSEGHVWRPDQQEIDATTVSWPSPGFLDPVH